jgi:hypothetical protein
LRLIAPLTAGLVAVATTGWADDNAACLAAHEGGQVARRAGAFDQAREQFAACQRDACPAVLRARCAEFARELEGAQPSIVVIARDARGDDVAEARVTVDGAPPVAVAELAVARRLNPGVHTLHAEAPGLSPADKTFTLPEGMKNMPVVVTLERVGPAPRPPEPTPVVPAPAPSEPRPSKRAAWAFAIGSGVSFAAAGTLSGVGWGIHSSLSSSCGTTCTDSQVEPLRAVWPASFVALGVGVASGVVATLLFLQKPASPAQAAENATGFMIGPAGAGVRFR